MSGRDWRGLMTSINRIVLAAVAALAIASPARAELDPQEKLFVELLMYSNAIATKCSGYE
jgi:hypothetical protein